jgi:hypothetical protein
MSNEEKSRLLELLSNSLAATRIVVAGIDPQLRVHPPDGWRVREVLGHIAVWDRESTKSLRAFRAGGEYGIPDLNEHDFNQVESEKQQSLSDQQIADEWEEARQDFITAVDEIPFDLFPGDMLYPWGDERGTIAQLVEYMVEHDEEHRIEITKASKAGQES